MIITYLTETYLA